MTIVEFGNNRSKSMVFCMVDTTHTITDQWIKEIIKNQADYTISNLSLKGYTILQGTNEDHLLKTASEQFDYACVFSTGTEFTNGAVGMEELEKECNDNFFIKGHILDRGDAYYELHQQCYLINLKKYKDLNFPEIGQMALSDVHTQFAPVRSVDNIHDDYTPLWIGPGTEQKSYYHKCHGWNIISIALKNKFVIESFKNNVRENKRHLYPESPKDFYKQLEYVYFKERYCANEFVHTAHTEWSEKQYFNIRQVIAPASGEWYKDYLSDQSSNIILYDYNFKSLEYWSKHVTQRANIGYNFVYCDLLIDVSTIDKYINKELENDTLINLSNIFCYEGTTTLTNLKYRLEKENQTINYFKNKLPEANIHFTARASSGFVESDHYTGVVKNIKTYKLSELKAPTWHVYDWS